MTTGKQQSNGNPGSAVIKSETLPARREAKTEAVTIPQKETVDDKIRKVLILGELVQQRRTLINHLERVESLRFGEFDEKDFIELVNSNGQRYPIKSIALCKKVCDLVKHEIQGHIMQVEEMIQL